MVACSVQAGASGYGVPHGLCLRAYRGSSQPCRKGGTAQGCARAARGAAQVLQPWTHAHPSTHLKTPAASLGGGLAAWQEGPLVRRISGVNLGWRDSPRRREASMLAS